MTTLERSSLLLGDCLDVLRAMPDCSVDSIVTDPPYGLSFMGKKWDYDVPSVDIWAECLRILKPGGHLLAFAGTRTQHRMAVRIEDAGFEIRDMIAWVYGSGFPKSLDVSKAIDKAAGHWRGRAGAVHDNDARRAFGQHYEATEKGEPVTEAARQWAGWGTALKPALEPITVARKPLSGTVAATVLEHGTGALNVDGCRVGTETITQRLATVVGGRSIGAKAVGVPQKATGETTQTIGRWPANLIHDGSDEVVGLFPHSKTIAGVKNLPTSNIYGGNALLKSKTLGTGEVTGYSDEGSAARFFYCAKASKRDRDEGCEGMEAKPAGSLNMRTDAHAERNEQTTGPRANHHPTVKPTDLMRYLCRLVTPPEGIVLDPFTGSGSTGKAAILEGFRFIGIERDEEYMKIAEARIAAAIESKKSC